MVVEALEAIATRLAEGQEQEREVTPLLSGKRAALWRAQHEAARRGENLEDLRRYCLQWLSRPRLLEAEHESDYLRGFREGLQLVLREIRRIETAQSR